jgi:hypothetical protein
VQAINGLFPAWRFQARVGSSRQQRQRERKQKGRREAGLFQI